MPSSPDWTVGLGLHACQSLNDSDRGIARYVREHALHLLQSYPENIRELWLDPRLPPPKKLTQLSGRGRLVTPFQLIGDGLAEEAPQVFHLMSPFEMTVPLRMLLPQRVLTDAPKLVVTLYDLIPLRYPDVYLNDPIARARYTSRLQLLRDADHILALSQTSAADATSFLGLAPEKLTVIYGGVSEAFLPWRGDPNDIQRIVRSQLPSIDRPFVFYTGGIDFRKNIPHLLSAFASMPSETRSTHQLVITCKVQDDDRRFLNESARRLGIAGQVVATGYVSDDLLRDLYRSCSVFVFPSLFEGFGLPMVEAMACGAPVVSSDVGSMREIQEIADARFSPDDPKSIAVVLDHVLTSPRFAARLREYSSQRVHDFSWDAVARRTAASYEKVCSETSRSGRRKRRKRIALVTPYPPQHSGIADYSERFLRMLTTRHPVDADVVVNVELDQYAVPDEPFRSLVPPRVFEERFLDGSYEQVVYCMGNSSFHVYMYDLLKRIPGVVWLHDARFSDFYLALLQSASATVATTRQRLRNSLLRYRGADETKLAASLLDQDEESIFCLSELLSTATRVLVNSRFTRELVSAECASMLPTTVLPFGCPDAVDSTVVRERFRDVLLEGAGILWDAPIVVSVGLVQPVKEPELLIRAIATTPRGCGAYLVFVGECRDEDRADLEELARKLGVFDRVRFPGRVSALDLTHWLSSADCAVQLRRVTNGECSAAVTDCLAHGLPTIVTAEGPLREYAEVTVPVPASVDAVSLGETIGNVLANHGRRTTLRAAMSEWVRQNSFAVLADVFWEAVCS